MTGIRTQRNGVTFDYVPSFKWAYLNRKVVKVPDSKCEAGVWITYPPEKGGYREFRPNSYYTKEMIDRL